MSVIAATPDAISEAAALLRSGALVAFPTETVYGLGADATNGEAVASIFEAKGRPHFNPLIVHVADITVAHRLAYIPDGAQRIAEAFWPGPVTLVLKRRVDSGLSDLVSAGLDTVALRMPDHPIARSLLVASGRPLAAPSANRSGHVSPTQAQHVAEDLGDKVAMVLDGGPTAHGIESTIIDASSERHVMLRSGSVPGLAIEQALGLKLVRSLQAESLKPRASGQLASHYAPRARVRLNVTHGFGEGEAVLAFGPFEASRHRTVSGPFINLSERADLIEAAANLFAALRKLDAQGVPSIAVTPIPEQGLGEAINDRLTRAAAPR
jgi:L-threonylcarbamoyladenylate synthase